ncbi:MAG: metallophosphoesterase family protein [Chitinophagales bacterium]
MKQIGILSDTHSYLDDKIFHYFKNCDEIWHAGDIGTLSLADELAAFKPLRAVYGNIDGHEIRAIYPENAFFECEGVTIWMTHIAGSPPRYNERVRRKLNYALPRIFVCGHSHILKVMAVEKYHKMLHINPGAAGNHGFHQVRTIMRMKIEGTRIFDAEVIELGKRGKI